MKEKYPYTVRSFFVSTWALPAATLFFSAFQWLYGRTSVLSLEGLQQGHTPGDVVPHQPLTLIYHPLNTHTHTHTYSMQSALSVNARKWASHWWWFLTVNHCHSDRETKKMHICGTENEVEVELTKHILYSFIDIDGPCSAVHEWHSSLYVYSDQTLHFPKWSQWWVSSPTLRYHTKVEVWYVDL